MGRPQFTLTPPLSPGEAAKQVVVRKATNAELGYPEGCSVAESFAALAPQRRRGRLHQRVV